MFLKEFPFALIYCSDEQGIIIYAMAHPARRPGYWLIGSNCWMGKQTVNIIYGFADLATGEPVALSLASAARFRCFTSSSAFRAYVEREILSFDPVAP